MSGTSYYLNKSISEDNEDLKRLQIQRDKLEKAALDFKMKGFALGTLTAENNKLKKALEEETAENTRINRVLVKQLNELTTEHSVMSTELELSKAELDKYYIYAEEIEKNNLNWRKECEKQSQELEELIDEADSLNAKVRQAEQELHERKEELNKAKLERQSYIQLKASLERQKHNYQMLETEYNTYRGQNEELRAYVEGLEEERIRVDGALGRLEREGELARTEVERETMTLTEELESSKILARTQETFIHELRNEIDALKSRNHQLKIALDIPI